MIRGPAVLVLFALANAPALEPAQLGFATARVFTPATVLFQIMDLGTATPATAVTTVSFDTAVLVPGQVLRISVKADGDILMPGGGVIPATGLAWTASNAINGIGVNGSLSSLTFTPVFQGNVGTTSGRVDLTWTLGPAVTALTAGTGEATLRWRFEAVTP